MNHRRAIAVLALLSVLDSLYLLLPKLGLVNSLSCSVSIRCDLVNESAYAYFLGMPVAAIGVVGYAGLFVLALVGLQPRWLEDRRPDQLLAALSGIALLFSLYLTYAEVFVLHAICQWCVVSQLIILAMFVLAIVGLRAPLRVDAG